MRFGIVLSLAVGVMSLAACGGGSDDGATADDDITATDRATVALANGSEHTLYVKLDKPSKDLEDAMVAAAKRGVDARAVLVPSTDFDASWMLQQHLESSGVDVDVRRDARFDDVVAVADDAALVPSGRTTKKISGAQAAELGKRFVDLLDGTTPAAGRLAARETVAVHPMPESSRDRIIALFGAARTSIDLEIYQLQDRGVMKALVAAAKRQVKVRVMLEPKTVGAANFVPASKELAAAGIDVKETPPEFDSHRNVDHAKFAVIDDAELIFGTGNLVRSGLGGAAEGEYDNRDFWVEDTRAANIKAGRALFDADWNRRATNPRDFDAFVLTPDNANEKIEALVDASHRKLLVYNQSLNDDDLVTRILAAKRRGVDVRVLLGYQPAFGGQPPANQDALDKLRGAGIKADFLKKHYLHAKAIVSDDRVYLGSQNFTSGGLKNNRELGEILEDGAAVAKVVAAFESDAR